MSVVFADVACCGGAIVEIVTYHDHTRGRGAVHSEGIRERVEASRSRLGSMMLLLVSQRTYSSMHQIISNHLTSPH